jgi:hypothetical protein
MEHPITDIDIFATITPVSPMSAVLCCACINPLLQVLARISVLGDADFRRVLHAVLHLFQTDRCVQW